jgi:hypothetical protein
MPPTIRKPPWISLRAEEALHRESSPYTPLSNTARSTVKKCPWTTWVPSEEEVEAVMQLEVDGNGDSDVSKSINSLHLAIISKPYVIQWLENGHAVGWVKFN